jgi:hypothetical protein
LITGVCHPMFQVMHLVFDLLQTAERGERGFVNCRSLFEMDVLGQQPKLQTARAHHLAPVRSFFSGDQTEDRSLAGAIPAN